MVLIEEYNDYLVITSSNEDYNGLYKISTKCYNFDTGIIIDGDNYL